VFSVLIETIISLAKSSGHIINLDIYGPVDDLMPLNSSAILTNRKDYAFIKGIIEPQTVQSTLTQYHFLALPTFHKGEACRVFWLKPDWPVFQSLLPDSML
jgi:hypothetical protein